MRVLGIDPGSRATGVAVVELPTGLPNGWTRIPGGPSAERLGHEHPRLLSARVIRPEGEWQDGRRLEDLAGKLAQELTALSLVAPEPMVIAIEDPTAFRAPRAQRTADASVKLGAAYGVCVYLARLAAGDGGHQLVTVPAQSWLPKMRRGAGHERHEHVRMVIRGWVRGAEDTPDDALFAAGIAVVAGQRAAADLSRRLRQHATAP